jgi:hypothetical protein
MSHPQYTPHPQSVGYRPGKPCSPQTSIADSYTKPPAPKKPGPKKLGPKRPRLKPLGVK